MRLTFVQKQRLKTVAGCLAVFFVVYFTFLSPGNVKSHKKIVRKRAHGGDLWDLFNSFDTAPRPARSKAFSILSENLESDWNQASVDDLQMTELGGGYTNIVFNCSLRHASSNPVILRVIFPELAGDEDREREIVKLLAGKGMGPAVLAEFDGGRIEEQISGRQMSQAEFRDKSYAALLGSRLSDMHSLATEQFENQVLALLHHYLNRIIRKDIMEFSVEPAFSDRRIPKTVTVGGLLLEFEDIKNFVTRNFNFPTALVHNDLFESNILIKEGDDLMLIDYEFSIFGHRAADIVAYLANDPFSKDPLKEVGLYLTESDIAFLHAYLNKEYEVHHHFSDKKLTGDLEEDTEILVKEAQLYWPVYNFLWGLENLLCYLEGNDLYDYEEQYQIRLGTYFVKKNF